MTNDVISFGQPNLGIFFNKLGNTTSELAVEKANMISLFNTLNKLRRLTRQILSTKPKTPTTNIIITPYAVRTNLPSGNNEANPDCDTVTLIKAKTPRGAIFIIFVVGV